MHTILSYKEFLNEAMVVVKRKYTDKNIDPNKTKKKETNE